MLVLLTYIGFEREYELVIRLTNVDCYMVFLKVYWYYEYMYYMKSIYNFTIVVNFYIYYSIIS